MEKLQEMLVIVLSQFGLGLLGDVPDRNVRGSVNLTYVVSTNAGLKVVQRLAPMFNESLVAQSIKVHHYLRGRGVPTAECCFTPNGSVAVRHAGFVWRVLEYIEHDPTAVKSNARVISAANMLGRFHEALKGCTYQLECPLEHFHDTRHYLSRLSEVARSPQGQEVSGFQSLALEVIAQGLSLIGLPETTPIVIHGDPKFDNFLYSGTAAVAIVDLDTLMIGSELLDLGDAMRSWCRNAENHFDYDLFSSAYQSYKHQHFVLFTEEQVLQATKLISIELTARYLTDAVEQCYFQLKPGFTSLREQNLQSARRAFEYCQSIEQSVVA